MPVGAGLELRCSRGRKDTALEAMSIPWLGYKYNCINNLKEINRPNLCSAQRCDFWGKAVVVDLSNVSAGALAVGRKLRESRHLQ